MFWTNQRSYILKLTKHCTNRDIRLHFFFRTCHQQLEFTWPESSGLIKQGRSVQETTSLIYMEWTYSRIDIRMVLGRTCYGKAVSSDLGRRRTLRSRSSWPAAGLPSHSCRGRPRVCRPRGAKAGLGPGLGVGTRQDRACASVGAR